MSDDAGLLYSVGLQLHLVTTAIGVPDV